MAEFTNYYDKNIKLLREYRPDLKIGVNNKVPEEIKPQQSKSGEVTVTCKGSLIHSRYNPVKEGRNFVETSNIEAGDTVICYGLGLGYHIEAILKRVGTEGKCYVIELNQSLLASALILRNLAKIITADNIVIVTGQDEFIVAEKCTALLSDIDDVT